MLQCKSITKRFGDFTALNDVSITVPQGGIFGLLGPNGAGKTTLIRIINRIIPATSGEVFLGGEAMTDEMVRGLGYLPEERGLYKKIKISDQAIYLARLRGMGAQEATAALKKWFKRLDMMSWWDKKVEELSKGMAQKVQFVITVLHNPSLIILDEPFSGFDPVNVQIIREEILRLRDAGTSVILSTHNMESVEELCDEIALIDRSRLVLDGPVWKVREDYGDARVEVRYKGDDPLSTFFPAAVEGAPCEAPFTIVSDEPQRNVRRAILELSSRKASPAALRTILDKVDITSYSELIPRMNDIFIKLVTGQDKETDQNGGAKNLNQTEILSTQPFNQ